MCSRRVESGGVWHLTLLPNSDTTRVLLYFMVNGGYLFKINVLFVSSYFLCCNICTLKFYPLMKYTRRYTNSRTPISTHINLTNLVPLLQTSCVDVLPFSKIRIETFGTISKIYC